LQEEPSKELWQRFINNQCSPAEAAQLVEWLAGSENEERRQQWIDHQLQQVVEVSGSNEMALDETWSGINHTISQATRSKIISFKRKAFTIAACVATLAIGIFFLSHKTGQVGIRAQVVTTKKVPAVTGKTSLILSDGTAILLDTAAGGGIALQGNTTIVKLDSGQLAYQPTNEKPGEMLHNTLVTQKGGQYNIVLPDGSRVWLNAASSLRFPVAFPGHERVVELTGEAYFEVVHNPSKPFRVLTQGAGKKATIEVLGTHFNISSYSNDASISATLLRGSIRLSTNNKSTVLRPGQQAIVTGENLTVQHADTAQVVAWKKGSFQFNYDTIETVMHQLERWYDIKVQYEGAKPIGHYMGTISRSNNLPAALKVLQESGLHCRLIGKTLIVGQ
jgi:transmembrane sensor